MVRDSGADGLDHLDEVPAARKFVNGVLKAVLRRDGPGRPAEKLHRMLTYHALRDTLCVHGSLTKKFCRAPITPGG